MSGATAGVTAGAPAVTGGLLDSEHPWPGLASFEERDQEFFRGRESETEVLRRLVGRARLTVLFGKSGLGKTSLLRAGLFPRLRQNAMLPVWIRLDFSPSAASLRSQILHAIRNAAAEAIVEAPPVDESASLWEYFHRRDAEFWNERQRIVMPVLVLDQFEEVFAVGREKRPAECAEFLDELSDLVEGRAAQAVRSRIEEHAGEADRFSFDRHPYKVVLSLREDFLADLESMRDRMPSIVNNRLRLRAMGGEEALQVVLGPGARLIEPDVAERVVRFVARAPRHDAPLAGLRVEPALLSLFCHELNARRLDRRLDRITGDLLQGSQTGILSEFCARCFADLGHPVRTFVEDQLVTESGYRDSVALERAISTPGVSKDAIEQLIGRRMLRSEERDGVRRIELTHDVLVDVIRRRRDERRARSRAVRRGSLAFGAAAVVLAGSLVWLFLDHRRHAEETQVAAAAVAAVLGETSDSSAMVVLNSARKSWDSAAAQGLDKASRAEAAARTVESVRDNIANENIQRLMRLLDDADVEARKAALADLFAYAANPMAVDEALSWLEPPREARLSAAGRINVLTFLRNTRPDAWTRTQLARGRTAIRSIRVPGPQTGDVQRRVLDEFDIIELALTTLYIQFAREQDRLPIDSLRNQLVETGLNVPAIELRPGDYRNEIRFFFDADSAASVIVADRIEGLLARAARPADVRLVHLRNRQARAGTIELWITLGRTGSNLARAP